MEKNRRQASADSHKINLHCPHYRNGLCVRQQHVCNNKDLFYEACVVFKGNNTLKFFMRQRKYFQPNIPFMEEQKQDVAEETMGPAQETH